MVKIRLKRMGYKKNPIFRVIVIDVRAKREGAPIEELGYYNPKRKELKLNKESALEWIKKGAQPTETVQYLIKNSTEEGTLIVREKAPKLSKKAQAKLEAEKEAQAAKEAEEKAAKEAAKAAAAEAAKVPAEEEPVAEVAEEATEATAE